MSDPYVGEIRMFGGNYAPEGWMFCNGQLLQISQYDTLYVLLGTTYGGDGQTTFGLPNLQGRIPIHAAGTYTLGQMSGTETVTLQGNAIPSHTHAFNATTNAANAGSPSGALMGTGQAAQGSLYYQTTATPGTALNSQSIGPAGGGQPHDNMMPYQAVSFIISLFGIYPSQS